MDLVIEERATLLKKELLTFKTLKLEELDFSELNFIAMILFWFIIGNNFCWSITSLVKKKNTVI